MRVEFTGRHIEVTEPIRKFTTDRLEKLRSLHDIIEVHVTLTAEKHQRHIAEVNIKTRHESLHTSDETSDMYTSIASALDKIGKQADKSKTRQIKRRRSAPSVRVVEVEAESVAEVEPEIAERLPEVVKTDVAGLKPLTVDDAAIEVGSSAGEFLVFKNAKTDRLNVVYRRKDGDIGWIEPQQ